jgi:hypothetical protein
LNDVAFGAKETWRWEGYSEDMNADHKVYREEKNKGKGVLVT